MRKLSVSTWPPARRGMSAFPGCRAQHLTCLKAPSFQLPVSPDVVAARRFCSCMSNSASSSTTYGTSTSLLDDISESRQFTLGLEHYYNSFDVVHLRSVANGVREVVIYRQMRSNNVLG